MTADLANVSIRAAFLLRTVARHEHADNSARLHCLYAAELLDPHTGMLAATADTTDVIRDALRLLAALPAAQVTDQLRAASIHARRALYELETTRDNLAG